MGATLPRILAVSSALLLAAIAAAACSTGTPPEVHPGDDLTNDTNDVDTGAPAAPPPSADGSADAPSYDDSSFQPMLGACSTCSCSPKRSFCFGGGAALAAPRPVPLGGHGEAGADAADDSGPPACPMVGGAKVEVGCNILPAACAAAPTCGCVLEALQPEFACYLNCTPDDGYLLVYCPSGP